MLVLKYNFQDTITEMEKLYSDLSEYFVFDKTTYQMETFFTDLRTFNCQFTEAYDSIQREKYAD